MFHYEGTYPFKNLEWPIKMAVLSLKVLDDVSLGAFTTHFLLVSRLSAEEHFSSKLVNTCAEVMPKYYKRGFANSLLILLGFSVRLPETQVTKATVGHNMLEDPPK